ncbi:MAG: PAS domain-containing protein [Sandaracinus sp.]|nr:PAS domain-containing protein [Sandaracinus sp.]
MNERHCIDVVGLFGDADAPTFWIELDGRVGWANEKARQITLAVTGREVRPGASMELFAVGDSLEPFRKSFARALAGESVVSRRHIEYPSGVGFFWEVRYVPTRASSGRSPGCSSPRTTRASRRKRPRGRCCSSARSTPHRSERASRGASDLTVRSSSTSTPRSNSSPVTRRRRCSGERAICSTNRRRTSTPPRHFVTRSWSAAPSP